MKPLIKHFTELGYSIVAKPQRHFVDFAIYSHDGLEGAKPLFHKAGSGTYPDPVEHYQNAEITLKGSVKWDGCSNWDFSSTELNMFHGCCKADLTNLGAIMGEAWDWTRELLPATWQGD